MIVPEYHLIQIADILGFANFLPNAIEHPLPNSICQTVKIDIIRYNLIDRRGELHQILFLEYPETPTSQTGGIYDHKLHVPFTISQRNLKNVSYIGRRCFHTDNRQNRFTTKITPLSPNKRILLNHYTFPIEFPPREWIGVDGAYSSCRERNSRIRWRTFCRWNRNKCSVPRMRWNSLFRYN